ncbi:uncharacterized protein si:dkey-261l7.2 isoform X2 [Hippoglossus hippoglossus]|uniref:uncharacterized protein si:dkey-261l7.2 isoform X2 n=1 Tax=Hippoglossus hippoglossus TaxID=8267 RepID=UPI00148C8175|nr:uncharacterized protein si:dkey-261l7.2 isoform X2 [Hippoglossus hippoglossus]
MPQMSTATVLQIALLLSAVPAQYLISRWSGSSAVQRYHATTRLLRIWKEWRGSYLNGTAWMDWANQHMSNVMSLVGLEQEETSAPPPVETLLYGNDQGFFGASTEVRSPRPPFVFLRVGEVVMERKGHMVGVVVSWDPELRAPLEWIKRMYSGPEVSSWNFYSPPLHDVLFDTHFVENLKLSQFKELCVCVCVQGTTAEKTPHYKVLFSGPGATSLLVAYLPQTQLERITGMKPDVPTLENYFTHFDGERFIMQPWLREIFPEDEVSDA